MMAKVIYQGDLRTGSTHLASGNEIITDAPIDNQGKGEAFSPTDLLSSALASCIMTIMGIRANDMNIDLNGMTAEVTKVMAANPRRVARVKVAIHIPLDPDEKTKTILENAGNTCPVAKSLHPDLDQDISYHWSN